MKTVIRTAFAALFIFAIQTHPALAATIHVPSGQPTIQAGIDAAVDGDLVLVAPGTYSGDVDVSSKAITIQSEQGADSTIIENCFLAEGLVMAFCGPETVLDGFTIRSNEYGIILLEEASPTIMNCKITSNNYYGIVQEDDSFASPTITNCTISENGDAGISIYSPATITNCTISGNQKGIACRSSATITNCTILGNGHLSYYGGGILCSDYSPTITNCTISDNFGAKGGGIYCGASYPTVTNCILWGNYAPDGPEIFVYSGSTVITYSDVQGGWPGTGNIDADPLFVGVGDYHLTLESPCIDTGTDAGVYTDMDGEVRPMGAGFDMGADEYLPCMDEDMDGYGDPADPTCLFPQWDCDDTDPELNPGAEELCESGIDEDCDGFIDSEDPDCVIIRVPADHPTIQAAIDASEDGNLILVAPGTYVENIYLLGKAITLQSESGADVTAISAWDEYSVVVFDSGETEETVLSGFTIRDGHGFDTHGGGIICMDYSSPTITDCVIMNNSTEHGWGGGIYCTYYSSPVITDCRILNNSASGGGGIVCEYYSSPAITDSVISNNSVIGLGCGGGIYCDGSSPVITNCTISENSLESGYGGGIFYDAYSYPTITNCTISGNWAGFYEEEGGWGGGVLSGSGSGIFTNCTISGNSAFFAGGGFYCTGGSNPMITNCILWGDYAPDGPEIYIASGSPVITYSDVQGGWPGTGNIDADPLFVGGGDYHLTLESPCIDTGTDAGVYTDMDGEVRPMGAGFDIGADEYLTCMDMDMDGYGDPASPLCPFPQWDCDDTDPELNPGAEELCESGIDEDCDGLIDSEDPDCVIIRVPADHPTIQSAIDASEDGNLILVAPGTYVENIYFLGKAITLQSESGADVTAISAGDEYSVVVFDSGETEETVLSGFTIRDGYGFESYGGGISCWSYSSPTIKDCVITNNVIGMACGGGIYCDYSSPVITNCTISENIAENGYGGGIFCDCYSSPTITNCTISGNWAGFYGGEGGYGGGVYCGSDSPTITNCTISGNSAFFAGGGFYCNNSDPTITNCILWENSAPDGPEIYIESGSPVVTYSDVQGGWPGTGNIDEAPLFVGGGDYHLTLESPCIDTGTDAGVYTDMDGDSRPQGAGFDMGADEYLLPCIDEDMDGYGDPADPTCLFPQWDCDDTDPDVNPGAEEVCDGVDNDCSGGIDEEPAASASCDSGLFCDGAEYCSEGSCWPGEEPCPDDGLFCTGEELCDEDLEQCYSTGDPCPDDGLYCTGEELCDEDLDQCYTTGDPCPDDGLFCTGEESCDEDLDQCESSGNPCEDDGLFCTGEESCDEDLDECVSSGDPCPDASDCTDDFCDEGLDACENPCIATGPEDSCCEDPACAEEPLCIVPSTLFPTTGAENQADVTLYEILFDTVVIGQIDRSTAITTGSTMEVRWNPGTSELFLEYFSLQTTPILFDTTAVPPCDQIGCLEITDILIRLDPYSPFIPTVVQPDGSFVFEDVIETEITFTAHFYIGEEEFYLPMIGFPLIELSGFLTDHGTSGQEALLMMNDLDISFLDEGLEIPIIPGYLDAKISMVFSEVSFDNIDYIVCNDDDGDGYGDPASPECTYPELDCDDSDPAISPGAEEVCAGGVDDDCDGLTDQEDPDCPVFTLELDASYVSGYLVLNYTIGTPEAATWANYLVLTYPSVQVIPLWSAPLPAIDPPVDFPVAFPLPSLGWVGIYTGLFTAGGPQAVEFVWVNTGTPTE